MHESLGQDMLLCSVFLFMVRFHTCLNGAFCVFTFSFIFIAFSGPLSVPFCTAIASLQNKSCWFHNNVIMQEPFCFYTVLRILSTFIISFFFWQNRGCEQGSAVVNEDCFLLIVNLIGHVHDFRLVGCVSCVSIMTL